MYQQTATPTTTRYPAQRPQIAGPFMLAGRQVARELFDAVQVAKRNGRRVVLVILPEHGDELDVPKGVCVNCLGAEHMGIDVLIAGPFRNAPSGKSDEDGGAVLRPAWYNGAWWQVARQFAPCPICGPKVIQL